MTKLFTFLGAILLTGTSALAQNKPATTQSKPAKTTTTTTTTTKTTSTTTSTTSTTTLADTKKDGEVYTYVEQMPDPGFNVSEFLSKQIVYPEDARQKDISGRCVVKFVIDEYGFVRRPEVVKSVYPSIDSTAIAVIKKMPRWKPGMSNGKPVKVYYTLPISFKLEEPEKKNEPFGGGVRR